MADELLFKEETSGGVSEALKPWKVLIVDDEEGVHLVTKIALEGFEFEGRPLKFLSAYSGREAMEIAKREPDIAVILLDVVMEEEDSGLKVAKFIREVLGNKITRIVLRTGQPGQAPEREVIVNYDINDYKTKTELTAQKLFTTMITALRSYRDLCQIESSKRALEKLLRASGRVFGTTSINDFAVRSLEQTISFLNGSGEVSPSGFFALYREGKLELIVGKGRFSRELPRHLRELIERAVELKRSLSGDGWFLLYLKGRKGTVGLLFVESSERIEPWKERLLKLFVVNLTVAFNNVLLLRELSLKRREVERYRETLERYLGSKRAGEVVGKEGLLSTREQSATVMFCDLRDFTDISSKMEPEEVVELLNQFFKRAVEPIFEYGGMLDKFLGDGLLAVFGVPVEFKNSEERAVRAALKIRELVEKWNRERVKKGKPPVKVSIGIHTGKVVSGSVGSPRRMDYTVVGKTVNLASRVESLNREFGTDILITEETYDRVKEVVDARPQAPIFVKGVKEPVKTYSVLSLKASA